MSYEFTQNWFYTCELYYAVNSGLFDKSKPIKILEIGSLEGSSTVHFSDNIMDHPDSKMTCIDPFDGDNPTTPMDEKKTKELFLSNIGKSKNGHKISLKEMYSGEFYKTNEETFTFIYIDGSHLVEDIKVDFINCVKILEKDGVMWMDDYLWGDGTSIRDAVDKLYEEHKDQLRIIHKGYQIGFRKF
jgi:predicted O-methyltransferase YrrM